MRKKIVIIGVGNLLMGDDGIGILAAWALMKEKLPENVSVFDGATRAFDVLEYIDGSDKAVIVDAYRNNGEPGSIYKFKFDPKNRVQDEAFNLSMHDINFLDALKAGMGLSSRLNGMLPVIIDSVRSEIIT